MVTPVQHSPVAATPFRRNVYATIGIILVGVAAVGAILPGIPTVGPLILASYFLTKSSPALEKRLVRNRLFAQYLGYVDGTNPIPLKTRLGSIAMMWLSIAVSALIFHFSGKGPIWLLTTLAVAGLIGTVFIWRFRRPKPE